MPAVSLSAWIIKLVEWLFATRLCSNNTIASGLKVVNYSTGLKVCKLHIANKSNVAVS